MNRFIEENCVDEDKWKLVFVDIIDGYYDKALEALREVESDPKFPFHPKDASRMLPTTLEASQGYRV